MNTALLFLIVYFVGVLFVSAFSQFLKDVDKKGVLKPFMVLLPFVLSIVLGLLIYHTRLLLVVWYINSMVIFTFSIISYEMIEKKLNVIRTMFDLLNKKD